MPILLALLALATTLLFSGPAALAQESWDIRSIQPVGEIFAHPLVFLVVFLFLFLPPAGRILRRTGHNPLWGVFALFPVLNLGAFWFFAFKSWPTDKKPPVT
ncbi:MAG TPA: hypothetical protein VK937_13785 [Candidatus Limnocylindria bacterium]|jgi:hypothetical protein|nr:hypothetical protein [Candidatus Limnocylindria bacterium]